MTADVVQELINRTFSELAQPVKPIQRSRISNTPNSYIHLIAWGNASLLEVKGDIQRSRQDGLLASMPGSSIADRGIDLKLWHEALKKSVISRPFSSKFLQSPLDSLERLQCAIIHQLW